MMIKSCLDFFRFLFLREICLFIALLFILFCQTTQYCVRFYKRSNGIVQIDYYLSPPNGDNQCKVVGTPQTQIITSTTLENQRCPFEGAYTIDAPLESDLTYNPSNIFICPRQSFLTAQCDHPSRIKIHSRCSTNRALVKNLYCLGSWTTAGLVRLLLTDDDRQRYSAWYKDYEPLLINNQQQDFEGLTPQAQALQLQQHNSMTRSQHLLNAASSSQLQTQLNPIIDLNIALITPIPIPIKTMQVRLTKKNQCSDLKLYTSSGSYGSSNFGERSTSSSSSMMSYISSSSAAGTSRHHPPSTYSLILLIVTCIFVKAAGIKVHLL